MRILYLTHQYFPRHVGGTEVHLRDLVRTVKNNGHTPHIITCVESDVNSTNQFHTNETVYESVAITEIHSNLSVTKNITEAEYRNPYTKQVVAEYIQSFQPNMIHVMHGMKLSGAAIEACHEAQIPTIITLCDFWFICLNHTLIRWNGNNCLGPKHPFDCYRCMKQTHGSCSPLKLMHRNRYLKQQLLHAKRIIALTQFQKEIYVLNGIPEKKIQVIPHGLNTKGLTPKKTNRPIKKVGFIGNLVPFKGAHILTEAMKSVRSPIQLHIFGPLTSAGYCTEIKKAAASDPRIVLRGPFAPDATGQVFDEIDLFAIPALWYENGPFVVKAALFTKTPVLASAIGSLREMVIEETTGWLLPPGEVVSWSKKLDDLYSTVPQNLSFPGVKDVYENGKEIMTIYDEVAETKRSALL